MMGGIPHSAIRLGNWKLIERHGEGAPIELYDLANDLHEDRNLAETEPERAWELRDRLHAWRESVGAQMPTPNPDYDPSRPTGWKRGDQWREMATVRE